MTAVLDFFLRKLNIESLNMKLTVLEDYLDLAKALEIWYKSGNIFLFFGGLKSEIPRQQSRNPR